MGGFGWLGGLAFFDKLPKCLGYFELETWKYTNLTGNWKLGSVHLSWKLETWKYTNLAQQDVSAELQNP